MSDQRPTRGPMSIEVVAFSPVICDRAAGVEGEDALISWLGQ
jgi:hypothetical protein